MTEITAYLLKGCSRCKAVMSEMDSLNIAYSTYICVENDESCDSLEDTVDCYHYPIIKLSNDNNIVYFCIENNKKSKKLNKKESALYFTDIPKMVKTILEHTK